jgi:predicted nucleic acid-binding Zn ribbon protein
MNPDETTEPSDRVDAAAEAIARARNHSRSQPVQQNRNSQTSVPTATGPDLRDPTLVSSALAHLLRDRGWERQTAVGGLIGRWHEIVGADIADHVVPESFQPAPDGNGMVLVLRADSTAWATSLRLLLPAVRSRIDAEVGTGTVRDISILGPAAPSWRHGKFTVQGRGPRDTYG